MARRTESKNEPNIGFDPRHRIVGAIILVSLAVILLPLILDERSPNLAASTSIELVEKSSTLANKQATEKKNQIAKKSVAIKEKTKIASSNSKKDVKTRIVVKKVSHDKQTKKTSTSLATKSSGGRKSTSKPVSVSKQNKTTTKKTTSKKIATKKTSGTSAAKQVASSAPVTKPHWAVQVGTFSNPGNVRRLGKQLKERGYSVMFKDVNLKQGSAVRVRVGPYRSRASADRAQGKIKKDIGVKGVVVAGP